VRDYSPAEALISLHIPKTAGTAFAEVLADWFPSPRLKLHYRKDDVLPVKHTLLGGDCIHGHFNIARGFGVPQYYPEATQFVTFMREPFDRMLSLWFFSARPRPQEGRVGIHRAVEDFGSWIESRAEAQRSGQNASSFLWQLPHALQGTSIQRMIDEEFVFIGLTDRMQQSVLALSRKLGVTEIAAPVANVTVRQEGDYTCWRPFVERHFADEYDVYEIARIESEKEINRLLRRYGTREVIGSCGDQGERCDPPSSPARQ
jgi:hypothetical protein